MRSAPGGIAGPHGSRWGTLIWSNDSPATHPVDVLVIHLNAARRPNLSMTLASTSVTASSPQIVIGKVRQLLLEFRAAQQPRVDGHDLNPVPGAGLARGWLAVACRAAAANALTRCVTRRAHRAHPVIGQPPRPRAQRTAQTAGAPWLHEADSGNSGSAADAAGRLAGTGRLNTRVDNSAVAPAPARSGDPSGPNPHDARPSYAPSGRSSGAVRWDSSRQSMLADGGSNPLALAG
jgi:hypothetical protein